MSRGFFYKRPLGVSVIGYIYVVFFGLYGILSSLHMGVQEAAQTDILDAMYKAGISIEEDRFKAAMNTLVFIQTALSVFYLVCGIGLLKRKELARSALVYFILFFSLLALLVAFSYIQIAPYILLFFVYPAMVFLYLTRPQVREWFQKENRKSGAKCAE